MKSELRRGRKTRYQAVLSVRVPPPMKAEIENIAEAWDVDAAEVVRRALRVGLPVLGDTGEDVRSEDVEQWWESLTPKQRSRWGKRLRHIKDTEAFRAEAYRRAMMKGEG